MIYAGIDVDIIAHEKALAAGLEAFGLWSWCMCWTQKYTTDGHIPRRVILSALSEKPRILRRALVRLVASRLLIESEDGSFQLFNYGKKNQSAVEIASRKEASRAANAARQQAARDRRNARVTQSNGVDVALPVTRVTGQSPSPSPSPEPTPPPEPSDLFGTASPPAEPVTSVKARRKPETPCPASGASAGEIRDWCESWKIPDGHGEFTGFLDHHRKSDARWRDWAAAWRTWLKNAARFGARAGFAARGAEITKQPADYDAPWMKLPEVG